MKKTIILILLLISVVLLMIRFSGKATELILGIKQKSGLSILSIPDGATIFLDGKEVGKTPYENKDLDVGEYGVKIEKEEASWQGRVNLIGGTLTVINRDLAKDPIFSAGEVLTLDRGRGVTVISNPSESGIEIDGKSYGKTPITINIEAGEHTILVSHPNYLKRSIRANLPNNFNLTVSVGLALSEVDLTTISTPPITTTPEVEVLETPTNFLRVRDKPSLAGKEIARVKPGDKLILLEELSGWDRIRLSDGTEGYVSSSYIGKKLKQ
ncbi:MAG: Serine/threonine-protein kinase [bacterium]|nr:MAG: Serine/threonine-protein kinase [bacterium]